MNRRAFLSALGLAAVAVPVAAWGASQPAEPWRPSARAVKRRNRWEMRKRGAGYRGAMLFYDVGGRVTPVAADGLEFAGYQIASGPSGDVSFTLDMRGRP